MIKFDNLNNDFIKFCGFNKNNKDILKNFDCNILKEKINEFNKNIIKNDENKVINYIYLYLDFVKPYEFSNETFGNNVIIESKIGNIKNYYEYSRINNDEYPYINGYDFLHLESPSKRILISNVIRQTNKYFNDNKLDIIMINYSDEARKYISNEQLY